MHHISSAVIILSLLCLLVASPATANPQNTAATPISVAVLGLETVGSKNAGLQAQAEAVLAAELSQLPNVLLVERAQLDTILSEQAMTLSGMLSPTNAATIGKLTGAQVLISGKLVEVKAQTVLAVRIISSETGRVFARAETIDTDSPSLPQLTAFAQGVASTIEENRQAFLADTGSANDWIAQIKAKIDGKPMPSLSITIPETHIGRTIPDPAAETAIASAWVQLGGPLFVAGGKIDKPEIIITGEAFSEFGLRRAELVSCIARVEVKAVDAATGRIIFQGAEHATGVDLGENIAAKKALANAGSKLAEKLLPAIMNVAP